MTKKPIGREISESERKSKSKEMTQVLAKDLKQVRGAGTNYVMPPPEDPNR